MTRSASILTEEDIGHDGPSKLFRALAIALLFVVAVNVGARFLLDALTPNRGYWLIRTKWRLVLEQHEPVDWLVLGDSSCNQGVRPDVFDPVVGGRSLNLCTIANLTVVNDAWMLETYLERQRPPRGVVLVHVYDAWHRSIDQRFGPAVIAKIPLRWGFWNQKEPHVSLDVGQTALAFAGRYIPLYAENEAVGRWILDIRTLQAPAFHLDGQGYMRVSEANVESVRADTALHLAFVRDHPFEMSDENRAALNRIVALADERGFDLYIADSPIHDALARDPGFMKYHDALKRGLTEIVERSPRVHYVLSMPVPFPETLMENADHVVDTAAASYTRRLASAVQTSRRTSAPR